MPNVITLTPVDVAAVTWTSADMLAALIPVPLNDGRSIVGPEVLVDVAHGRSRVRLSTRPQVDYATIAHLVPGKIMSA